MEKASHILVGSVVAALIAGGVYYWYSNQKISSAVPNEMVSSPAPTTTPVAKSTPPVEALPQSVDANSKTLPALDQSDSSFEAALMGLFGKKKIVDLFDLKEMIRKTVVTVENGMEQKWSLDFLPYKPVQGEFKVKGNHERMLTFDSQNEKRYEPYIHLVQIANLRKCVAVYARFYSLFQTAYRELNATGDFNHRLVEVVDHLLETPDPKGPIQLFKLNSNYKYVDPELEHLSVTQKILIRIGPNYELLMKAKLREFRNLISKLKA